MRFMEGWTKTVWQHVAWESPPDWEILRYSSDEKSGGCVMVDRYEERLQVIWNRPVRSMDLERLVSDQRSRQQELENVELSDLELPTGWGGYFAEGEQCPAGLTRAARWFSQDETLIEINLAWTDDQKRNESIEHRILESVSVDTRSPLARWKAFGIDLLLPREFKVGKSRVEPGKNELRFETEKSRQIFEVRRLGLPNLWLKEPLREWLHRIPVSQRFQVSNELPPEHIASQGIEWMTTSRRKEGFASLSGTRHWRRDAAWLCKPDNRVFHVTLTTEKEKELETIPYDLRCTCGTRLVQGKTS